MRKTTETSIQLLQGVAARQPHSKHGAVLFARYLAVAIQEGQPDIPSNAVETARVALRAHGICSGRLTRRLNVATRDYACG